MADRPAVKICGLTRREDVLAADAHGADLLGAVLSTGFGRSVPIEVASALMTGVTARRVAVLVDESADDATRLAATLGAHVIQLHGVEDPSVVETLADRGAWTIWKAVRASDVEAVGETVARFGGLIGGIVVEGRREGVVGGGGVELDLDPRSVRIAIPRTVDFVLAGGLSPDNIQERVARFAPDVVDVSSGVEADQPGRKDAESIRLFIERARGGSGPVRSNPPDMRTET
jgi:phosphoribosylanthranilate isomerase